MPNNDNLELILFGWLDAIRRNDLDALARQLHPQVVWQGVRPDLVCRDRDDVMDMAREGFDVPTVEALELTVVGIDRIFLGIRSSDLREIDGEPLGGEIYQVFTIREGTIVRIDEFTARDSALRAAERAA